MSAASPIIAPEVVPVVHRSLEPVHIIGHGRSGTSNMVRLLRDYLRISFGTESQFIIRFHQNLASYGDLTVESNRRRLVEHICTERWFQRCYKRFRFTTTPDAILADIREFTYPGVLAATFRQLAKHFGLERWGDKTPEYHHDLDVLLSLFPKAKFIHMVRDGRDVALSGFETAFGEKNVYMAAVDWTTAMREACRFAETVPADQLIEIRYEDLLTQPTREFNRLIEFLDIDDADGRLLAHIDATINDRLMLGNFNKWKQRLTPRQIARFDGVACDFLRRYGYECTAAEPARRNWLSDGYWRLDSTFRNLLRADHLADNVYRARLRLTTAMRRLARPASPAH
ncbi:MAG: sulfotransferase [Planctomyces sp.]|nr:sulfotransferase [Planctomyces sp.]